MPPENNLNTILFEVAPIGLGLTDMTGKIVLYNKMLLTVSGFSAEDIEGLGSVADLYYDPKDRGIVLDKLKKEGHVDNYPIKFKKKDGSYFDALLSLRQVTYNGAPHFLALTQDITEKIQTEKKIAEKVKQLEEMNKAMVGRELKMTDLKQTLADVTAKLETCLASKKS